MELPPGPSYVIRTLLQGLPVSLAAYGFLRVLAGHLGVVAPNWSPLVVLPLVHLAVNFVMEYWRAYRNRVDAAAHGAVLPPRVMEDGVAISDALVKSMHSGYPGARYTVRCVV